MTPQMAFSVSCSSLNPPTSVSANLSITIYSYFPSLDNPPFPHSIS